ncbi:hypothetical protein [Actinomadura hibisca]|uniref:hypothetical protein n=1 Tax=Actinomadura hibisca TaxID=68565 RepID=UPI0008371F76|nr:hypothetical protein [Actinomadura hibisca]
MRAFTTSTLLGTAVLAACAGTAHAAPGPASATGPKGQTLTVSQAAGLDAKGAALTVTGKGYDTGKGVYVAFCKDNGPDKAPSPCGGGADTSGKTGGSQWVSSNPPPYGKGLATPYGAGGTFSVQIKISSKLSDTVDCAKDKCAVVTRADHTRASDRSQDVRVPVTFGGGAEDEGGIGTPVLLAGGGAAVLVIAGAAVFILRRRSGGKA